MKEYLTSEAERAYRKRYYQQHRNEILRKRREKYLEHREAELARNKCYRMTHDRSEYFRQYRIRKKEENHEQI